MSFALEDRNIQALLRLLAWELFDKEPEIDAAAVDWQHVLAEADRQVLTALLYPGLKRLSGVPEEIVSAARSAAISFAMQWERILPVLAEIVRKLGERNIPCAVLKGASVAMRYPHPELRVPGDIDVLVNECDMTAASETLTEMGFALDHTTEMHDCFSRMDATVELHRVASVFPDTQKGRFAKAYMAEALQSAQMRTFQGRQIPVLTGAYQMISLLAHMERHISNAGIGLRQVCDWAVIVQKLADEIGEAELQLLDQAGLLHFAQIITRGCEQYLGLPTQEWAQNVSDGLIDEFIADVLLCGNFHVHAGERTLGTTLLGDKTAGEARTSLLQDYAWYVKQKIRRDHSWAKGKIWYPLFWLYFPIRWYVLTLTGKRRKADVIKTVHEAKKRKAFIRKLKLY